MRNSKKGFTIIEVVLVLAIAGLIFLMVFVALPALQRSQRDTQRRNDLARVATAITQYQTNNNGKIPNQDKTSAVTSVEFNKTNCGASNRNDATALLCSYLNPTEAVTSGNNDFVDPDGTPYVIRILAKGQIPIITSFDHKIIIATKAKCKGDKAESASNARDYAILYKLEGSGTYCADNQ